jgi:hypothetical protein
MDWKRGSVHPPPSPARADFSIMMGCMPQIGNRHSVCILWFMPTPFHSIYHLNSSYPVSSTLSPAKLARESYLYSILAYCLSLFSLVGTPLWHGVSSLMRSHGWSVSMNLSSNVFAPMYSTFGCTVYTYFLSAVLYIYCGQTLPLFITCPYPSVCLSLFWHLPSILHDWRKTSSRQYYFLKQFPWERPL